MPEECAIFLKEIFALMRKTAFVQFQHTKNDTDDRPGKVMQEISPLLPLNDCDNVF